MNLFPPAAMCTLRPPQQAIGEWSAVQCTQVWPRFWLLRFVREDGVGTAHVDQKLLLGFLVHQQG